MPLSMIWLRIIPHSKTLLRFVILSVSIKSHKECMVKFAPLGRQNMSLPNTKKIRAAKITFTTVVSKQDFMYTYNNWDNRKGTFCSADLTPEEREAVNEYRLRKLWDLLRLKLSNRQSQVRNGAINACNSRSDHWLKFDDSLETDLDDTDSLWNVQSSNTGQTSNNAES